MGCSATRELNAYSELMEGIKQGDHEYGPLVNPIHKGSQKWQSANKDVGIIDMIKASVGKNMNRRCLGHRKPTTNGQYEDDFSFITYKQMWTYAERLAKNFNATNMCPNTEFEEEKGNYKFIGIFAKNSVEWVLTDIAAQLDSVTSVTFYATLGEEAFNHIINQTNISTICVGPENIDLLVKYYKKFIFKTLKNVVVYDYSQAVPTEEQMKSLKQCGFGVHSFKELMDKEVDAKITTSKPDTLLTLCYTSGTTNLPKGVKQLQRGFASQKTIFPHCNYHLNPDDVHFSYLPMAHIFERLIMNLALAEGLSTCFITGEVRKYLLEDMAKVKPTLLIAVPRVLSMFRQQILDTVGKTTGIKRMLADRAISVKRSNFEGSMSTGHWMYDKLMFNKIREKFGGKLKVFITGSAPLAKEVGTDIKIIFGIPIIEAYGLTETTGAISATSVIDFSNSNTGGPIPCNDVKLVAVPEMKYGPHTKDPITGLDSPTGEVCAKGISITPGYWRDLKNTNSAIDKDGWFHTGDVGRITPGDKGLKIIDRVKEIFKLAQGEYIAPSKLEGTYSKSQYVAQICIYGDSLHTFCIGIIFPNKVNMTKHFEDKLGGKPVEDLYETKEAKELVVKDLEALAVEAKFNGMEKIKNVILSKEEFSPNSGLLTPTLKLVRNQFKIQFKDKMDAIYNQ